MGVCVCLCHGAHVESEGSLWKSVLSYHVGTRDSAQVVSKNFGLQNLSSISHSCQQLWLQLLVFYHLPKKWLWGTGQFDWYLGKVVGWVNNLVTCKICLCQHFTFFSILNILKILIFSLVMWCWQSIHLSFYTVLSCIPGPYFPNKEIIDWIHFVIDHLRKIKVLSSADRI